MSGAPASLSGLRSRKIRVDGQRLRPAPGREPRRGKVGASPISSAIPRRAQPGSPPPAGAPRGRFSRRACSRLILAERGSTSRSRARSASARSVKPASRGARRGRPQRECLGTWRAGGEGGEGLSVRPSRERRRARMASASRVSCWPAALVEPASRGDRGRPRPAPLRLWSLDGRSWRGGGAWARQGRLRPPRLPGRPGAGP